MESNSLLVIGAGGLGCRWARAAHSRVSSESDLMLVDADMRASRGLQTLIACTWIQLAWRKG